MIRASSALGGHRPAPSVRADGGAAGSSAGPVQASVAKPGRPSQNPPSPSDSASQAAGRSGIRPHEEALSGYLLARAAMGRKIDDFPEVRKTPMGATRKSANVLQDLRAANDTLEEARRALPHGRGNVKGDIIATRGEASRRLEAGAKLAERYVERKGFNHGEDPLLEMWAKTAASHFTGQASCGGSALVAAHLHAPKLEGDQSAIVFHNPGADHMWTEATRRNTDRNNDQIIDRWTAGPAVLRQDSKYGRDPKGYDAYTLNTENREKAVGNVAKIVQEMKSDRRLNARFDADMKMLEMSGYKFNGEILDEENVMSDSFRHKAGKILHPGSSKVPKSDKALATGKKAPVLPFAQEVLAAGVARSLGEGIPGAVEMAPAILDAAKRMFPKPHRRPSGPSHP